MDPGKKMISCMASKCFRTKKAQSAAEYSVCLALILAAFLGMQLYVKRGLQGKYKEAIDHAAKQSASPKQYEPYYEKSKLDISQSRIINEDIKYEGQITRTIIEDKVAVEKGSKAIKDVQ